MAIRPSETIRHLLLPDNNLRTLVEDIRATETRGFLETLQALEAAHPVTAVWAPAMNLNLIPIRTFTTPTTLAPTPEPEPSALAAPAIHEVRRNRQWRHRERKRMETRTRPVWWQEGFVFNVPYGLQAEYEEHFVHVSEHDPSLLAFTPDQDHGERDVQVRIKPGRYLTRYYAHCLDEKRIKSLVEWQTTGTRPVSKYMDPHAYPMEIATSLEEIVHVYRHGPYSCMKLSDLQGEQHYAAVYAAGDLAVAWLHAKDNRVPVARAVVWPEKKAATRVYPTPGYWTRDRFEDQEESLACNSALGLRLRGEGYRMRGDGVDFDGARLLKLPENGSRTRYILPYFDGPPAYGVDFDPDDPRFLRLKAYR